MMKKYIFLMLSACLFLMSCESTPKATARPQWVDDPKSIYDDEMYITRVGEGFSKTEALADANLELAKYFGQSVKSTVHGNDTWTSSTSDGTHNEKTLSKDYTISFDTTLFAVNRTKPWFDVESDSWYICVYLNREEAFEIYKPTLMEAKNDFYNFYNEAVPENDFFKKLSLLKSTEKAGAKYLEVLNFAQIILPSVSTAYKKDYEDITSVNLMISQLQNSAAVKVDVENDYGSKLNDYITKVFTKNGFNISNSGYQYVVDATVDYNKSTDSQSGIICAEPSVTISLIADKDDDILFTYTRNFDKIKTYREDSVKTKTFAAVIDELESSFENELLGYLNK